jgi:hypothetical protein
MIKASELRIGNAVFDESPKNHVFFEGQSIDKYLASIFEIQHDSVELFNDGQCGGASYYAPFDEENIHPIPLTEDWLKRLGFVAMDRKETETYPFVHIVWGKPNTSNIPYHKCLPVFMLGQNQNGFHFYSMRYVYTVHELQNLYFALTGEELTIKDK